MKKAVLLFLVLLLLLGNIMPALAEGQKVGNIPVDGIQLQPTPDQIAWASVFVPYPEVGLFAFTEDWETVANRYVTVDDRIQFANCAFVVYPDIGRLHYHEKTADGRGYDESVLFCEDGAGNGWFDLIAIASDSKGLYPTMGLFVAGKMRRLG